MTSRPILVGDCREVLAALEPDSVDAVVTDPPYELGFMGKSWDASGVAFDPATWAACLRVLKPGGHLLAFGGTRTIHRITCAIEDSGFQIRDCLAWMFGTGFPKSLNVGKDNDEIDDGTGTALKPAYEPIVLARKPLTGTVAANVLAHGTGGLRIDDCRIGTSKRVPSSMPKTQPDPTGWSKPGGQERGPGQDANVGRWPANVVMDEAAGDLLDEQSGTSTSKKAPRGAGMGYHGAAGTDEIGRGHNDTGGASRFLYCAKASRSEREAGLEAFERASAGELTGGRAEGSAGLNNPRTGAGRTSSGRANVHPTVKPIALMRWLVRLVTPAGGIVLDPFTGSGTTGCATAIERVGFLGCELSEEYATIARARIAWCEDWRRRNPDVVEYVAAEAAAYDDRQQGLFG